MPFKRVVLFLSFCGFLLPAVAVRQAAVERPSAPPPPLGEAWFADGESLRLRIPSLQLDAELG